MKVLTKNTDYAIRALMHLARKDKSFVSAKEMADEQKIPYQFLRRILQKMIRADLVVSKEGAGGGVKLKGKASKINVSDVIMIFQGEIELSECMFRKEICCNRKTCVLRKEIKEIEKMVKKRFSKITIQKLLSKAGVQ